eukprot:575708-Pelagomonas_calceolata.AAC.5
MQPRHRTQASEGNLHVSLHRSIHADPSHEHSFDPVHGMMTTHRQRCDSFPSFGYLPVQVCLPFEKPVTVGVVSVRHAVFGGNSEAQYTGFPHSVQRKRNSKSRGFLVGRALEGGLASPDVFHGLWAASL